MLSHNRAEIESRVHAVIDKFAERGLRSLGVARQVLLLEDSTSLPKLFDSSYFAEMALMT